MADLLDRLNTAQVDTLRTVHEELERPTRLRLLPDKADMANLIIRLAVLADEGIRIVASRGAPLTELLTKEQMDTLMRVGVESEQEGLVRAPGRVHMMDLIRRLHDLLDKAHRELDALRAEAGR